MKKVFFIIIAILLVTGCAPISEGGELYYPYSGGESVLIGDLPQKLPEKGHFVVIDLLDNYAQKVLIRVFFQGEEKCSLEVTNPLLWEQKSPLYFNSENCAGLRITYIVDFVERRAIQKNSEHETTLPVYIGITGSDLYYQWEQ